MKTFKDDLLHPLVLLIGDFEGENKNVTINSWNEIKRNYIMNLNVTEIEPFIVEPITLKNFLEFEEKIKNKQVKDQVILPIALHEQISEDFDKFLLKLMTEYNIFSIISCQSSQGIAKIKALFNKINIPVLVTIASDSDLFGDYSHTKDNIIRLVSSNENQVAYLISILRNNFTHGNEKEFPTILDKTGFFFNPQPDDSVYTKDMMNIIKRQLKQYDIDKRIYRNIEEINKKYSYWVSVSYSAGFQLLHNFLATKSEPDEIILTDGCNQRDTYDFLTLNTRFESTNYTLIKYAHDPDFHSGFAYKAIKRVYDKLFELRSNSYFHQDFYPVIENIKSELEKLSDHYKFINNENIRDQFVSKSLFRNQYAEL